jgi:hypothetical protein
MFLKSLKDVPEEPVTENVYSRVYLTAILQCHIYESMYVCVCMYLWKHAHTHKQFL